ncbi:MAG: hypothetical protein RL520_647, partial [Pseudomonadota bacterium]
MATVVSTLVVPTPASNAAAASFASLVAKLDYLSAEG